eukprot:6460651-Amphidinium_carterae.1
MEREDRERCLAKVQRSGYALKDAAEIHKADREIVLAAVRQNCRALQYAADSLRSDRDFVLAAVMQTWRSAFALQDAADCLKSDAEIVLVAVEQNWEALPFLADDLLEDSNFATEARLLYFILKVAKLLPRAATSSEKSSLTRLCTTCHTVSPNCSESKAPQLFYSFQLGVSV